MPEHCKPLLLGLAKGFNIDFKLIVCSLGESTLGRIGCSTSKNLGRGWRRRKGVSEGLHAGSGLRRLSTVVNLPWRRGAPAEADGASCSAAAAAFRRFSERPASSGARGGVTGGAGHMLRLGPRGPPLPAGSAYGLGAAPHRSLTSGAAVVNMSHGGGTHRGRCVHKAMPCTACSREQQLSELQRCRRLLTELRGQAVPKQSARGPRDALLEFLCVGFRV